MDIPQAITSRYGDPPYFFADPLYEGELRDPAARSEYVLWLDLMGMQNIMRASLSRTANFAAKLVMAAEQCVSGRPAITPRPVIDGAFIHGTDLGQFLSAAHVMYAMLAMACLRAGQAVDRLVVRGGMAYGPVVRGGDIPDACFLRSARPDRVSEIIFGQAVSDAYAVAEDAPPFGVNVHSSAASVLDAPGGHTATRQWRWWEAVRDEPARELAGHLRHHLEGYYRWCEEHPVQSGYRPERLMVHRALFREHYGGVQSRSGDGSDGDG